jgi:hypothetical protein
MSFVRSVMAASHASLSLSALPLQTKLFFPTLISFRGVGLLLSPPPLARTIFYVSDKKTKMRQRAMDHRTMWCVYI